MSLIENVATAVVWSSLVILGALAHEYGHYILGRIVGNGASFNRWSWGIIPTQTVYDSPAELPEWKVRVLSGVVLVFPVIAGIALWVGHIEWFLFGLGGASTISATDLIALYHPEVWKKMSADEPVTWDDFGEPSLW